MPCLAVEGPSLPAHDLGAPVEESTPQSTLDIINNIAPDDLKQFLNVDYDHTSGKLVVVISKDDASCLVSTFNMKTKTSYLAQIIGKHCPRFCIETMIETLIFLTSCAFPLPSASAMTMELSKTRVCGPGKRYVEQHNVYSDALGCARSSLLDGTVFPVSRRTDGLKSSRVWLRAPLMMTLLSESMPESFDEINYYSKFGFGISKDESDGMLEGCQ